jgi:Tfp pilus assembly protein PilF
MAPVTPETVLGQFPAKLTHHKQQTEFFRTQNIYTIKTDTLTAQAAELQLKYTFGIFPLQQYLTELPNGYIQSLPFAWDSRPKEQGGQQWFHLYANEPIFPGDALHWRSNSHNANHMCIECHTTNFEKKFDPITQQFHSTWLEMGVGCESCHGPGSKHIAWTNSADKTSFRNKGWNTTLTSGSSALWQAQTNDNKPHRTTKSDEVQVEQCAQCHSRRSRISSDNTVNHLLDSYMPVLLEPSLYHPDGQILDEVFEYGSFLQSKMHNAGVTCSNCHNPHSGKVKIEGNGLCLQCHSARHDAPEHTLHTVNTPGSACIDCHMPAKTYMSVDKRRDHSFRIPRPDLSKTLGTPNACQQCHQNQSTDWAIQILTEHFGTHSFATQSPPDFGPVFDQAQKGEPRAFAALTNILADNTQSAIVRATAASLLGRFPTRDPRTYLSTALGNSESLIRLGALQACDALPAAERKIVLPLLTDNLKAVRIEAARLASVIPDVMQQQGYAAARTEYIASQTLNNDRAPALVSLASLAINEQRMNDAENLLLQAIQTEPWYVPASVNLADMYRSQQRDNDAEHILKQALTVVPDNADLHLSYGLLLVRQQKMAEALQHLQQTIKSSTDPYHSYVYALALQQTGDADTSKTILDTAAKKLSYSRDIQLARLEAAWNQRDLTTAKKILADWLSHDPEDPAAIQWKKAMETKE